MALTKVTEGIRTLGTDEVIATNIATDAVTTGKILDDNVTIAKIAGSAAAAADTFLKKDGTWVAAGGGFNSVQYITSGTTYTRPSSDITKAIITLVGGGGGGGGGFAYTYWGGAGGGGGVAQFVVTSVPATAVIQVGVVGTGGSGGVTGVAGGNTIWNDGTRVITATGGSPGGTPAGPPAGVGGSGGVPVKTSGADPDSFLYLTGGRGTDGSTGSGGTIPGLPLLGYGFAPYDASTAVNRVGTGYGWGGWGGPDGSAAGYDGGQGLIIVAEFK